MKTVKSLLCVLVLLSTIFIISNGQSNPTTVTPYAQDVIMPWGQNSATGTATFSYGGPYTNYETYLYVSFSEGSWDPNQYGNRPTSISFTVNSLGQHTLLARMTWFDGQNYQYGPYKTCTFNVVRPPQNHGNNWAYVSSTTYPGDAKEIPSNYISPGSIVNYSLSATACWIQGPRIDCYAMVIFGGINDGVSVYSDSDPYQQKSNSKTGSYTASGGTTTCYAIVNISQGFVGGGQASAYISW